MIFEALWDAGRYAEETALLAGLCDGTHDGSMLLAADLGAPRATLERLIAARRSGTLVALYPVLDDPYEAAVADIATHIASLPDIDGRRTMLRALGEDKIRVNGGRLADFTPLDERLRSVASFVCKLADLMLFATEAERQRFQRFLGRELTRFTFVPLPEPRAAADRGGSPAICIFAPSSARNRLHLTELALEGCAARIDIVAAGDAPAIQSDVAAVVCPEWWRPIRSAAVAASGFRVVAPRLGGADERGHARVYDEIDARSMRRAVSAALTERAPDTATLRTAQDPAQALKRQASQYRSGPLVSVIVRTFDRPQLLLRALESIAAQQYRPLEAIVVNGGGPDIRPLLGRFENRLPIVYVDAGRRTFISESSNLGAAAAAGDFIAYLDDDDVLYPDHIARCAETLACSGADLVYTNCVAEYAETDGTNKRVLDITMYLDRDFDPDTLLVSNIAPIHSIVHRRDVFERFGRFDESFAVCDDWEMWTRVAQTGTVVHIDRATCEYSWRWDSGRDGNMTLTQQQNFVTAHGRIYARLAHRVANRPSILDQQRSTLDFIANRAQALALQPERARELLFTR